MKKTRTRHYIFMVLAIMLLVGNLSSIFLQIRGVRADESEVRITSPAANAEVNTGTIAITGTAPASKQVVVFNGKKRIGIANSNEAGNWSINWRNTTPGEYSLRAVVVDGTHYKADPLSRYSLKGYSINSGQVEQNFEAGFSYNSRLWHDSGRDEIYSVNGLTRTVSVVDSSKQVSATISYGAEETDDCYGTGGLANITGTGTNCPSLYDDANDRLYILGDEKVFVVNTQSRELIDTIEGVEIANNGAELAYQLYLNPQSEKLYIYHAEYQEDDVPDAGPENLIQRIDIESGAVDQDWREYGNAVVSSNDGNVYFSDSINTLNPNRLLMRRADPDQVEVVATDAVGCTDAHTQLLLSQDGSKLYSLCEGGKLLSIATANNQITSDIEIGNKVALQSGNLTGTRLFLYDTLEGGITFFNTQSDTVEGEVSSFDGRRIYPESVYYDEAADRFYFIALDLGAGQNNFYEVNTDTRTIVSQESYPITDFAYSSGLVKTNANEIAFTSQIGSETIHFIDIATGERDPLVTGHGWGSSAFVAEDLNRIFTVPSGIVSSSIRVSNTETGDFVGAVSLPSIFTLGAVFNEEKTKLFVYGVTESVAGVNLYEVDTATLQVTRSYESIGQETSGFELDLSDFVLARGQTASYSDGVIYFAVDDKLLATNLTADTTQAVALGASYEENQPRLLKTSANDSGDEVAILMPDSTIRIYSSQNLELVREIDTTSQLIQYSVSGLDYVNEDEIIVYGVASGSVQANAIYSTTTGEKISNVSLLPDSSILCNYLGVSGVQALEENRYLSFSGVCLFQDPATDEVEIRYLVSIFDKQEGIVIYGRTLGDTTPISALLGGFRGASREDTEVLSTQQQVTVVADTVTIISPAANAKLQAGTREIRGTARPNTTVTVKIDGNSIGTAESDEFGLWKKNYNFATVKSYNITAEYNQQARGRAYLNAVNYTNRTGKILMWNTQTDELEGEIELPDGFAAFMSRLSKDKQKLYTVGYQLAGDEVVAARLYTYATNSNDLVSTVDLEVESDEFVPLFTLSEDEDHLYLRAGNQLYEHRVSDGDRSETYDLGDIPQNTGATSTALPVVDDAINKAVILYEDCSGMTIVNLQTKEATQHVLPENVCLQAITYDSEAQRFYTIVLIDGVNSIVAATQASNFNSIGNEEANEWLALIEDGSVGVNLSVSQDGGFVYAPGGSFKDNIFKLGVFKFNSTTGAINEDLLLEPNQNFLNYLAEFGVETTRNLGTAEDPASEKLYVSTFRTTDGMGSLGIFNPDDSSDVRANVFTEEAAQGYSVGSVANGFIAPVAGERLSAQRTVSVVADTTNPTDPTGPTSPTTPTNPVNPANPDPVVTPPSGGSAVIRDKETRESLKKVAPEAEQRAISTVSPFTGLLVGIRQFAQTVPLAWLNVFPYLLFILLILLIAYYLYQTQMQLRREDRIREIFKKQRVLAEEKRNFLELTSHYLRTPLTYIKAGSEIIMRNKQNEVIATELAESVGHLGLFIESLIEEATVTKSPELTKAEEKQLRSPLLKKAFLLPLISFFVTLGLFYLIFGVIGGINFGPNRYVTQLLIAFLVVQVFYGIYKNHHKVLDEEEHITETFNQEVALDHARSKLMKDAGVQLKTRTDHLGRTIEKLEASDTSKSIMQQGVDRLQELSGAFALVSQLESEVMVGKVQEVSVRSLAAEVIEPLSQKFKEKKVSVEVAGFDEDIMLSTNKPLAELTLKSLIENALSASEPGDSIVVKCIHKEKRIAFQIIDHGEGIPKDKIDRLFKPFVRVGPVTTFNREGIGLSLYLDRLIMHSLGGEIEIASRYKHGTTATLNFKQTPA